MFNFLWCLLLSTTDALVLPHRHAPRMSQEISAVDYLSVNGRSLRLMDEECRRDRKIVELAVREDWRALQYADPRLRSDRAFVAKAMTRHCTARITTVTTTVRQLPRQLLLLIRRHLSCLLSCFCNNRRVRFIVYSLIPLVTLVVKFGVNTPSIIAQSFLSIFHGILHFLSAMVVPVAVLVLCSIAWKFYYQ